jgi:hypothetical protein
MKIKRVITSGCSFSETRSNWTWPKLLENYVKSIDPEVTFDHRGLSAQGQELIQKKATHAVMSALDEGLLPEEIAVIAMWSGTGRKSWYITNPNIMYPIIDTWGKRDHAWELQFVDLENNKNKQNLSYYQHKYEKTGYNKAGGWYITGYYNLDPNFMREYFTFEKPRVYDKDYYPEPDRYFEENSPLGQIHMSIENMIFLQNFLKVKGITFYQQYYMDFVRKDIEQNTNEQLIGYLAKQLDDNTFVSKTSIHGYVKHDPSLLQGPNDPHPSPKGHQVWFNEVLQPFLQNKNFFL